MKVRNVSSALLIGSLLTSLSFANEDSSSFGNDSFSDDYSVTGFFAGVDLGSDLLRGYFQNIKESPSKKKNKTKIGMIGDFFAGYNFQLRRFIVGLEGFLLLDTARPLVKFDDSHESKMSVKRKYSFGFSPKFGCAFTNGLNGYLKLGFVYSKFNAKSEIETQTVSKNPNKTALSVGFGVEKDLGKSLFVRAECNKIFKKDVVKNSDSKISAGSLEFKIGGGYRF